MQRFLHVLFGISFFLAACTPKTENQPPPPAAPTTPQAPEIHPWENSQFLKKYSQLSTWEKKRWISSVAKLLTGGSGLGSKDNLAELLKLKPEDIADYFLRDERFGETVLDFNISFLGFKLNRLHNTDGTYSDSFRESVFDYRQAILSAKEVNSNGDYLKIFELYPPVFMPRLGDLFSDKSDEEIEADRDKSIKEYMDRLDGAIAEVNQNPETTIKDFCEKNKAALLPSNVFSDNIGLSLDLTFWFSGYYSGSTNISLDGICDFGISADLKTVLARQKERTIELFTKLETFKRTRYKPKILSDIRALEVENKEIGLLPSFGFTQGQKLLNSSTNFNRKRAAYILKRYFCDEMTGITVEDLPDHTEVHGSSTACYACHYKLDPMAGFFKGKGLFFFDFKDLGFIVLDDRVTKTTKEYEANWLAPSGSNHKWNIGYIRSVTDEKLNQYGENLEDLFAMMKEAPEVRQCLVKRFFQYATSAEQVIDGGYLKYLSEVFSQQAKINSAAALKNTVKAVALSSTFAEQDRQNDKCYDFAPGYNPDGRPPCRVSYVIEKNCVSCHSEKLAFGGLDLSSWIKAPEGYTFRHLDSGGTQKPRSETMKSILDRLSTGDVTRRMPLKAQMPSLERDTLYKWANEEGQRP